MATETDAPPEPTAALRTVVTGSESTRVVHLHRFDPVSGPAPRTLCGLGLTQVTGPMHINGEPDGLTGTMTICGACVTRVEDVRELVGEHRSARLVRRFVATPPPVPGVQDGHRNDVEGIDAANLENTVDTIVATLRGRRPDSSTHASLADGPHGWAKKIVEEAYELGLAIETQSDAQVIEEAQQLLYRLLLGVMGRGLSVQSVIEAL